jgi:hypothetical protein
LSAIGGGEDRILARMNIRNEKILSKINNGKPITTTHVKGAKIAYSSPSNDIIPVHIWNLIFWTRVSIIITLAHAFIYTYSGVLFVCFHVIA